MDPLVGRETQVERVIQILCKRRKGNACLVGDAGVGKTAIAEGFAQSIVKNAVTPKLQGCKVYIHETFLFYFIVIIIY